MAAQQGDFLIEPLPDWTTSPEIKAEGNPLEKQAKAGVFFLLFNVEINAATRERFIHFAQKYISSAGVEGNSRLSFVFDPAYQQLVIHKIVVHRGGQILNQLAPDRVRVIQQEKELDRLIYNGAKTALLFLEDVRVGDWVEVAYTIRGRNPIEAGHFFEALQLRYPFPIQSENYRLLWPRTNAPLWVQISGDAPRNRNVTDHFIEYAWRWEDRRGQETEDFVPQDTIQCAMVHFSDYKTWEEVGKWAEQSFRTENVTEELYKKIMKIRAENATDEDRVVKALQFVQDEIRYLGIEDGINSHKPTNPSVVFARGYGDCKDKALLFCTMLRFFDGVDASPVLVSTRFRQRAKQFIATPLVFDHAVVRVIVNGKTNFVDVTRSFQRGPLDRRFIEYFGAGVLLDPETPGLIDIPMSYTGMPQTRIVEDYDISTNGSATLVVTSTFQGRDADFIRRGRAVMNPDSIEDSLLTLYQKSYDGVVAIAPPVTHDDELLDTIQVTRRYHIEDIWKPALQTNRITCEFIPRGIFDRLYLPAKKERKLPLFVSCPENFIHNLRIRPHESWRITPTDKKIETKELLFRNRITCTNNEVVVTCQLLTMRQQVEPADVAQYCAALEEIPKCLGLTVTKSVAGVSGNEAPNWSIWVAAISYSVVLLVAASVVYRFRPKSPPPPCVPPCPNLVGLGGWLIFLGIALLATPLIRSSLLIKQGPVYSISNWRAVTDPASSGYDSMLAPILLYELFLQVTLLIFSILLIALYFRKKRTFKTVLIIYLSFQFVGHTVDKLLADSRPSKAVTTSAPATAAPAAVQTLVPLVLWGLYVVRSRRVKMTFVN